MNLFDNNIISILISLTLIYALLSIFVSILTEWWNYFMRERGKMLRNAIIKLLSDPENHEYGQLFFGHFMISGLRSDSRPPQYISSGMFAEVLIDVIAKQAEHSQRVSQNLNAGGNSKIYTITGAAPPDTVMGKFEAALNMMEESSFKDMLVSFMDKSGRDYERLKKLIAVWYDDYMDRVTGWYKSKQRIKLMIVGLCVAVGLNVDSLHLVKVLSLDDNLRNTLVNTAESVADNYSKNSAALADSTKSNINYLNILQQSVKTAADTATKDSVSAKNYRAMHSGIRKLKKKIALFDSASIAYLNRADSVVALAASLGIPIGWNRSAAPLSWIKKSGSKEQDARLWGYQNGSGLWRYISNRNNCPSFMGWIKYIIGIIITGVSLSFGAPFWFEMLVKLVNIRRAGKKPEAITSKK